MRIDVSDPLSTFRCDNSISWKQRSGIESVDIVAGSMHERIMAFVNKSETASKIFLEKNRKLLVGVELIDGWPAYVKKVKQDKVSEAILEYCKTVVDFFTNMRVDVFDDCREGGFRVRCSDMGHCVKDHGSWELCIYPNT